MLKAWVCALFTMICLPATPQLAAQQNSKDETAVEKRITETLHQMYEAEKRKDMKFVLAHLADDFAEVAGDGNVYHRADIEAGWADVILKEYTLSDCVFKLMSADAAYLSCKMEVDATYKAQPFPKRFRVTTLWTRQKGEWLVRFEQGTVIAEPSNAAQTSEQERNKAVARGFFEEVLDQGRLERYAESHASDFVAHGRQRDFTLEEDIAAAREEHKALPDLRVAVHQAVAEGDMVAVYWTATGTNTGEGMGFPATGKRITIPGMTLFRFKDGKISEEWSVFNMASAMQQAGLCSPRQ